MQPTKKKVKSLKPKKNITKYKQQRMYRSTERYLLSKSSTFLYLSCSLLLRIQRGELRSSAWKSYRIFSIGLLS